MVAYMNLLTNHVKWAEVMACACEHDIRNYTIEKVRNIYYKIYYKFILTPNRIKQIS